MAYYNQNNENNVLTKGMNSPEEDEKEKQQTGMQPMSLTSQSSAIGGTANQAQAPAGPSVKPSTTPSSGMASGFQNYVKANEGKAQNDLNRAVAQNVQAKSQIAKSSINQANNAFQNKVEQGTLANRHQAVQDVANISNAARKLTAPTQGQATDNAQKILSAQAQHAPTQTVQTDAISGGQELSDDLKRRFQEVINAKYQGPESIRQAGLYHQAAKKVSNAQNVLDQTKTANTREEMLRNMYEARGDYTRGLNKLDAALLNQSQQGVKNLQDTAAAQGNIQNQLDQAQIGSAYTAQNRANEINQLKEQAMGKFSETKKAEEAATEARLANVVKDWDKLPEYFKDIIRNKGKDNNQMLTDTLTKLKKDTNYAPIEAQYNKLAPVASRANALLESALRSPNKHSDSARRYIAKYQREADAANKALAPIAAKKAAIDSQISKITNNFNENAIILNPFEADVLGVSGGEGIYNMGVNAIKTKAAEKDRLISKDEQLRQAALSQLAGLDASKRLDTNLKYADAAKAGTMSSLDALDLEGFKNALRESEQNFRDDSRATTITGHGHKKVSRGNMWGKKTKHYYATQTGNVGKMLESAGYDLDAPIEAPKANGPVTGKELLKTALATTEHKDNRDTVDRDHANGILGGAGAGAAAGYAVGNVPGAVIGGTIGAGLGGGSYIDNVQNVSDLLAGYAPGVGNAIQDIRSNVGEFVGGAFGNNSLGKGIAGAIGGISSSAMKSFGTAIAKQGAIEDLKRKYSNYLEGRGFENRVAVADNDVVKTRMNALAELLAKLDKTNT